MLEYQLKIANLGSDRFFPFPLVLAITRCWKKSSNAISSNTKSPNAKSSNSKKLLNRKSKLKNAYTPDSNENRINRKCWFNHSGPFLMTRSQQRKSVPASITFHRWKLLIPTLTLLNLRCNMSPILLLDATRLKFRKSS